ncbi:pyridoxal phosphate-dependent transferase [Haematococcus lacustris]
MCNPTCVSPAMYLHGSMCLAESGQFEVCTTTHWPQSHCRWAVDADCSSSAGRISKKVGIDLTNPTAAAFHLVRFVDQHTMASNAGSDVRRRWRSSRAPSGAGFFLEIEKWKLAAKQAGRDIIDMSVGLADMQPQQEPLDTLRAALEDPSTYSYCLKSGTRDLRQACCDWYAQRYGLQLDPDTQALTLIGSQEGLAHLLLAVADQGDTILMCDVAYASYWGAVQVAGLQPAFLQLDDALLPRFDAVDPAVASRAKVLLLNYPNNPTAATATNEFFSAAIAFCLQHDILLVHDNPYVDLVYEGVAPSPLCLPGGMDCCIELFSFAKSYHIAGFRLGWALGNADAMAALEAVKAPIDFNQYRGIQRMGVTCLTMPQQRVKADAQEWKRRAAGLVQALAQEGWAVRMPASGMYLWARLPCDAADEMQFCQDLLAATGVALGPGRGFGPGGHGYVRISLVHPEERLREAAARIGDWAREKGIDFGSTAADNATPKPRAL